MRSLKKALNNIPRGLYERIRFIGRVADELGYSACVIGGFVRDLLLGVENFDLDILVEGDGINFARKLSSKINSTLTTHLRFKTATLLLPDKTKIDIATARREVYEHPGSLPKVTPGTIKDDICRRDFSINAMGFSIRHDNFGELLDLFKGREDLKNKKIRVLHDLSFIDDPTRILRAIRFEQRYNFKIEPHTLRLIAEAVRTGCLHRVQKQRLRDEIILLLKEENPLKCIRRLDRLCGLDFIHPAIYLDAKKISLLERVGSIFAWFQKKFPYKRKIELWLAYLIILLEGLGIREISKAVRECALLKGEAKRVISFESEAGEAITKLKKPLSPSQIYRILEPLSYEVILLMALKASSYVVVKKIKNFLCNYNEVKTILRGEDLKRLGIAPGPGYKEILGQILYAKLDNKLLTKAEELLYLKNKVIKPGSIE